jgi:RNA polymerase sigma-70 factor (ECF subfamily)
MKFQKAETLYGNIERFRTTNHFVSTKPVCLQKTHQHEEFLDLVKQHQNLLHKVCNLYAFSYHDRQDLFQEMIIQLWKSYSTFRGESKFSTWLYRIALNTAITGLRRKKKLVQSVDPVEIAGTPEEGDTGLETEEKVQLMYKAIGSLSEIERALVMLYLEDKSYDEMEEILGINQNNLRVKMNRAKEKLRNITKQMTHGAG